MNTPAAHNLIVPSLQPLASVLPSGAAASDMSLLPWAGIEAMCVTLVPVLIRAASRSEQGDIPQIDFCFLSFHDSQRESRPVPRKGGGIEMVPPKMARAGLSQRPQFLPVGRIPDDDAVRSVGDERSAIRRECMPSKSSWEPPLIPKRRAVANHYAIATPR